jgi:hypothetical protein
VAVNVTATNPQAPGFVQLFPAGGRTPGATSSVNVDHADQTIANLVIVGVDAGGKFSVHAQSPTHLVVDVLGYFTPVPQSAPGRFVTVDPIQVLDTRTGLGSGGAVGPPPPATSPST